MHPSWHPDPTGRHELRYWDGSIWTDHVANQGVQAMDPLMPQAEPTPQVQETSPETESESEPEQPASYGADPFGASGPVPQTDAPEASELSDTSATPETAASHEGHVTNEALGSVDESPEPQATAYSPAPAAAAPAAGFARDAFAGITGDLIDGRFSEKNGAGVERQNNRMLRVRVTEPFMARQGSMVAYQGDVRFNYQGGGAAKFLKKAFTGEGLSLMRVEGSGDVFLADQGHHVHILNLHDTGISISGTSVLAFSAGLEWNIERVKGGSIATGGLFNTTVRGTGWVAITTDGEPVVLNAGEAATFADTDAVVAWSAHLQTSLRSTMSAGALIGRGSGEALQVTFSGQGFVIVQPSEGAVVPPHSH
ncbi:AIM24 family protein [Nocardioides sp.]|uniref:AIM24 family protein n=1 Tax=Nocardioides sp. TaxID=35761 RepID=UPI002B26D416|nr:AIM24 family protein [Nocardioides sp.]